MFTQNVFRQPSCILLTSFWNSGQLYSPEFFFLIFSSATFNSETAIGFGWSFQKLRASLPRYDICRRFKYGVLGGHCFFLSCLQKLHVQAFLRDTYCVRRVRCISLNISLRLAAVGCSLQWTVAAEISKQLQLLFARTLTLTLQWRHCHVSCWYQFLLK